MPAVPAQRPKGTTRLELPRLKVGSDIFEINGQPFLLMVDYFSKYPEGLNLKEKTSHTNFNKMKFVSQE